MATWSKWLSGVEASCPLGEALTALIPATESRHNKLCDILSISVLEFELVKYVYIIYSMHLSHTPEIRENAHHFNCTINFHMKNMNMYSNL